MRLSTCLLFPCLGLGLLLAVAVSAQEPTPAPAIGGYTVDQVLAGKALPLTIKVADLKAGWQQFTLEERESSLTQVMRMGGEDNSAAPIPVPVYYTKGDIVMSGGESYLLVYQRLVAATASTPGRFGPMEPPSPYPGGTQAAMIEQQMNEQLSQLINVDTPLTLTLLHLADAGNLVGVHPFDLPKLLAESAAQKQKIVRAAADQRRQRSLQILRRIGSQVRRYARQHHDTMPPLASFTVLSNELGGQASGMEMAEMNALGLHCATNPTLSGKRLADFPDQSWIILLYEDKPSGDGTRAVVYLNGNATRISEAEFRGLKRASRIP